MKTTYRTHTCGQLRASDAGAEVTLCGWVGALRNQGGVLFVDLRDRYGVTQVTFRGDRDVELLAAAERVRGEWVLRATGTVAARPSEAANPNLATGEIEVEATALEVLAEAETPPIPTGEHAEVSVEMRLRHRYLDLRRQGMSERLAGRAAIASSMRWHLEANGFVDVETPTLIRSTPEGARDYLVPSRVHPGSFYALPQSPQLLKQLLMIGGQDRYYQIARCYRDEDLRADRQPEFTQVDIEASFVSQDDVHELVESLMDDLLKRWRGHELRLPIPRLTYREAMERFGSDKPDLRNPLELVDLGAVAAAIEFPPFTGALEAHGRVKALVAPGGASFSRKQIEALDTEARQLGAPGIAWCKVTEAKPTGPLARFLATEAGRALLEVSGAKPGDLLLAAAGDEALVHKVLGALRATLGERLELVDASQDALLWITEFPLVGWDDEAQRFVAVHHPFTKPSDEDLAVLEAAAHSAHPGRDPEERARVLASRADAYDLVLNGHEIAGGSLRIHRQDVQQTVFRLLGMDAAEVEQRFGWFVSALRYGTPPHGGIAFGFDRLVACLLGVSAIQDVIAFPKSLAASDLFMGAPSSVDATQLHDLGLALTTPAPPEAGEDEA